MSLLELLASRVPKARQLRGDTYYAQGRVLFVAATERGLDYRVRGTETYRVTLQLAGRTLHASCTCPFTGGGMCKHVWAALREAETAGRLAVGGTGPGAGSAPPGPPAPSSDHAWRELVAAAGEGARPAPPSRFDPATTEVVPMIDLDASGDGTVLAIRLMRRDRRADGAWSDPKPLAITYAEAAAFAREEDRRLFALIRGADAEGIGFSDWRAYSRIPNPARVTGDGVGIALHVLASTGRALVKSEAIGDPAPLAVDGGGAWAFEVEVREAGPDGRHEVAGIFTRGHETIAASRPDAVLRCGYFFEEGRASRFDPTAAFPLIERCRQAARVVLPAADGPAFVAEMMVAAPEIGLRLPGALRFEDARVEPAPRLHLGRPHRGYFSDRLEGRVHFDYDGHVVPEDGGRAAFADPAGRRLVRRDLEAEGVRAAGLADLGFRAIPGLHGGRAWALPAKRLPRVVPALLAQGWRVEAEGKLFRRASSYGASVVSKTDWFELHGFARFGDEEVPLPRLLAALQRGETTVLLGDGTFGVLPEEWLQKYALPAGLGEAEDDHLRFRPAQLGLLDALLAEMPEATCDELFDAARARLRTFEGVKPQGAPQGFQGTLRPYQKDGLGWFSFLRDFGFGGCLADDMGLGKTVQVLALLEARRRKKPSLVVAPKSLVLNWRSEAARFTPKLRVMDHTGLARASAASDLAGCDLVLTSYGTLRRDAPLLREVEFDYVVLDEAQAIKNAKSQAAKAARLLRADHRLALSGTPIENHLGELWSLFEFLNPGMLGASSAFKLGALAAKDPDGAERRVLARALRPFLLRRTKQQVAKDLPARTEQTLTCELGPVQRSLYDEIRDHYRRSLLGRVKKVGIAKSKIFVLEALLRLRQAACHPGLLDASREDHASAKLDLLEEQTAEVIEEGHKALVFSQFTSLLALLRRRLDAAATPYAYLDGQTPAKERAAQVRRFQEDASCPLFLLSLKAGGLGLNLTAAEYVYLLDPWWNPAVEAQAVDRAHRIGQTKPVFAYRLVASDTIEEKILALQATKRDLADAILQADESVLRGLTREDLEMLLG